LIFFSRLACTVLHFIMYTSLAQRKSCQKFEETQLNYCAGLAQRSYSHLIKLFKLGVCFGVK